MEALRMARDPHTTEMRSCPRPTCEETLETYPELLDLAVELHLAEDHGMPWNDIRGWPRGDV